VAKNLMVNREALKLGERDRLRTRDRLADYMVRTGLSRADFASRINYSRQTLDFFLRDRYHHMAGSAGAICTAINTFIDAHPIAPTTEAFGSLYDTANVRAMRATFQQLLRRPVAYMIYAPPGSEKTFVLRHMVAELNRAELSRNGAGRRAYYVYARVNMRPTQLLKQVAVACGISSVGDGPRIARNLGFEFQGRRVLLVVDEAQHLALDCLEGLRGLLDEPPHFSLLLSGSHDLKQTFDRFAAHLGQWNSRIIEKVSLPGVARAEAEAIVERELGEQLQRLTPVKARKLVCTAVDSSMDTDEFAVDGKGKRHPQRYINVRTLTNTIDRFKMPAPGEAI
jgi:type II secretory pathway predicted ATPase ExeA